MAVQIKDMGSITKKWLDRAGSASGVYADGVANPLRSWEINTKASEAAFKAGVTASLSKGSWLKGLSGKQEKWSRNAVNKGAARYSGGVAGASDDYNKGFEPYRAVIAGLTLTARGPKGDPVNLNRVAQVAKALHDKKVGG